MAQLDTSPLTPFMSLVLKEEKKADEKKSDTPALVVNQCTK